MKKPFQIVLTIFLSVIVLAACNTAEEPSNNNTTATSNEQKSPTEESKNSGTTAEQPTVTQSTDTSITYTSEGQTKTEETTLVDSDKYSLRVLPGYALTAEEPGKDLLYLEDNDAVSMRIETMPKNDTTFNDLKANSEETMTAIKEEYEPFDVTPYLEGNSTIQNSTAYVANFEENKVVLVVLEKEDLLVRLTIFDENKVNLTEAFIKMGLTIEAK